MVPHTVESWGGTLPINREFGLRFEIAGNLGSVGFVFFPRLVSFNYPVQKQVAESESR